MKPVIAISLLVFWAVQFALQALAALKGMPLALFLPFHADVVSSLDLSHGLPLSLLAVASGLIAALFAWAAICRVAGRSVPDEGGDDTARLAFSAAIAAVTVLLVLSALRGVFVPFQPVVVLIAALGVTWMAVQRDQDEPAAEAEDEAARDARQLARHMAGEVAHKTMLGAISRRPGSGAEAR